MKRYSEKRDKALALRNEGKTYQQIAEVMGVSRQRIGQLIGHYNKSHFMFHTEKSVIYKKLRCWMNENLISVAELCEKLWETRVPYYQIRLAGQLRGKTAIRKDEIDRILNVTGFTYEECFRR